MNTLNQQPFIIGDCLQRPAQAPTEQEITAGWRSDMPTPAVSILCSTYNQANHIHDALNSFLHQQTDFPFEIIVHDDASTDGTRPILESYQQAYPNIIRLILQTENQYSQGKRPSLFTLPLAQGKYIADCEGDDFWLDSRKIATQYALLENNPAAVMCYHDALVTDDKLQITAFFNTPKNGYSSQQLARSPHIPTLTRFYRKVEMNWLNSNHLPRAMDIVHSSYLSRYGSALYTENLLPCVYRKHDGGVWSSQPRCVRSRISLDTLMFIAGKYEAENNADMCSYFKQRAASELLDILSTRAMFSLLIEKLLKRFKKFFARTTGMSSKA